MLFLLLLQGKVLSHYTLKGHMVHRFTYIIFIAGLICLSCGHFNGEFSFWCLFPWHGRVAKTYLDMMNCNMCIKYVHRSLKLYSLHYAVRSLCNEWEDPLSIGMSFFIHIFLQSSHYPAIILHNPMDIILEYLHSFSK
jgi:hypothetical protein